MKQFIKFPIIAFICDLSHAERSIYLYLLRLHFQFTGSDYSKDFYVTDRHLSSFTGCSTESIWRAKKSLKNSGLIDFRIGDGNKTFYKILSGNGDSPT